MGLIAATGAGEYVVFDFWQFLGILLGILGAAWLFSSRVIGKLGELRGDISGLREIVSILREEMKTWGTKLEVELQKRDDRIGKLEDQLHRIDKRCVGHVSKLAEASG